MATNDQKRQLNHIMDSIGRTDWDRVYKKHLGKASLAEEAGSYINELFIKLDIANHSTKQLSTALLNRIIITARKFKTFIEKLSTSSDSQFVEKRESLLEELMTIYDEYLDWWPQTNMALSQSNYEEKAAQLEKELDKIVNQRTAEEEKFKKNQELLLSTFKKEIDNLSKKSASDANTISKLKDQLEEQAKAFDERYKEVFTKREILKQEDIFGKEANTGSTRSFYWLMAIGLIVILLSVILWWLFHHFCFELSCFIGPLSSEVEFLCPDCGREILLYEIVKASLFRIFILSIVTYLLVFAIKNYNANMHNRTVNSHKQNSLAAALVLLDRTQTEEGKDKIIILAAQSIFTHQRTGYYGKDSEPANPLLIDKILEKVTK